MYSPEVLEIISALESKECDDCGKKEVEWTSLRRGTIICSECFCFHSYLGPSVSLIRNLRKGAWDEEHMRLLHALNSSNTNMIWENALYEGTTKWKKPEPGDPSHFKEQFIREKYEKLSFQPKRGKGDDMDIKSLNSQLIACARSDYVHLTLRLIALGADVNYVDPESGDTALHVAAREGNGNQVELLFLHGADILVVNKEGLLPHAVAKEAGQTAISQRIYEFFWYIFDRFTFYVCSRKPDHKNNQDFFIPEVTDKSILEKTKLPRSQLSSLRRSHFFDLCEDAFDEVIRRENEANWITTTWSKLSKGNATLFLPPSPQMSAARNQRRQKLAKMSRFQFTVFLIDLMKEQKRNVSGEPVVSTPIQNKSINKSMEKSIFVPKKAEYTDYDEVAGAVPASPLSFNKDISMNEMNGGVSFDEILELKERVGITENLVVTLTKQNEELTKVIHGLQAQVINMNSESISMREEISRLNRLAMTRRLPSPLSVMDTPDRVSSVVGTPQSMGRRESEDRIDIGGARWRSNSRDRLNANSNEYKPDKRVEKRIEIQTESSSMAPRFFNKPIISKDEFNNLMAQADTVTQTIRTLLDHGHHGRLENNASNCAFDISFAINTLIAMFPKCVNKDRIDALYDALVLLNAKCNSPQLMPLEIIDSSHLVADKIRLIIRDPSFPSNPNFV